MPLLPRTGRSHPRVRALIALMYLLLVSGAATMVYPFLLMLAGSTKSKVDETEFRVIPSFWRDDLMLYRKHMEALFNERLVHLLHTYGGETASFAALDFPETLPRRLVEEWALFVDDPVRVPPQAWSLGHLEAPVSKTLCRSLRVFKAEQSAAHGGNLDEVNAHLGTAFVSWSSFRVDAESPIPRRERGGEGALQDALTSFKMRMPVHMRALSSLHATYLHAWVIPRYARRIEDYNRAHGTHFQQWSDVPLTARVPVDAPESRRREWEEFVRTFVNPVWIRVEASALPRYQHFLRAKYGEVEVLNRLYDIEARGFEDIELPDNVPPVGLPASDWDAFLAGWTDPGTGETHGPLVEELWLDGVDFRWRAWLQERIGDVELINQVLGTHYATIDEVPMPQAQAHYVDFLKERRALRFEFSTRTYRQVLDYLWLHGRGIWNTAVYCSLAVLLALIVNPLAAYALSRYRLRGQHRVLLFMMVTMAFPPMVTQIPVFFLLKDFGLLNTFAALVLPGIAHGYSIFLLKGFFDSLPRELYESAQIDGAGEWTLFWSLTMSLSRPILAVIALHAFTTAYSNFMFALLICQDQRLWTIMVWLFKLQSESGAGVVYASLILAAIPTLLVFLLCQRFIMRGIVVPVEK